MKTVPEVDDAVVANEKNLILDLTELLVSAGNEYVEEPNVTTPDTTSFVVGVVVKAIVFILALSSAK